MTEKKKLVIVLGMHRSGTSAITRGLEVLNIELGYNLQPGMKGVNKKGFFEDNDIVSINEELLSNLDHEWNSLEKINWKKIDVRNLNNIKSRATKLLEEKVQLTKTLAIKDPRTSILLPFWQEIFSHLYIDVKYLLAIRNPLSVADSLYRRDGFSKKKSAYLWAKYVSATIKDTNNLERVIVDYDNLMKSPSCEISRIQKAFRFEDKLNTDELEKFKTNFLENNLRHTQYSIADLKQDLSIPTVITDFYEVLFDVASDKTSINDKNIKQSLESVVKYLEKIDFDHFTTIEFEQKTSSTLNNNIGTELALRERIEQFVTDQHEEISLHRKASEKLQKANQLIESYEQFFAEALKGHAIPPENLKYSNKQIQSLNAQLKNLYETVYKLNEASHKLKQLNEIYRSSTSWKATKPLRSISGLFKDIEITEQDIEIPKLNIEVPTR